VGSPEVRYPCPCCGHVVFDEPPGCHLICPVCAWEDDPVQLRWPDRSGGANRPALIDAQRTYAEIGAKEARVLSRVRPAAHAEPVEPRWRRVDLAVDPFEPRGVSLMPWPDDLPRDGNHTPWPEDRTVLYYWRPTYWRLLTT
jgi:hypothetical protein